VEFANRAAALGIRVVTDLVVNHTSIDHPWFQQARTRPDSPFRDWYVWSKKRPANHADGVVFPGSQDTTWTYDKAAREYYFHRFYAHQADLNTGNKAVRDEIYKIMGFWLELGVSGFRMDAVPFLIERKGAGVEPEQDFSMLQDMRDFLQWRRGDAILLAEANVPPDESIRYFGDTGQHLQLMLNFPVNQCLWYALATADLDPLKWAIRETSRVPKHAQFVQFLRSHDECDLGRLTPTQRRQVFRQLAPRKNMQLYNRGIRRRMAAMLQGDRRRIELAFSLLFSLPGTPMLQYGDEIGIWDDLSLPERECARTAMQWSDGPYGGYSTSEQIVVPIVDHPQRGYRKVNVAAQRRDENSLLNWTERRIRMRKELVEVGWGEPAIIEVDAPEVLVLRYVWRGTALVFVHNFADARRTVRFDVGTDDGGALFDVFDEDHTKADASGRHAVRLAPYGHKWFRVGGADTTLHREPLM
jgi:maltose alpha-D-glucosyltransferase/alpha-amylase